MDKNREGKMMLAIDILKSLAKHKVLPPPLSERIDKAAEMTEMRMSVEMETDPDRFKRPLDEHERMYWILRGNIDSINDNLGYTAFELTDNGRPDEKESEMHPKPETKETDPDSGRDSREGEENG